MREYLQAVKSLMLVEAKGKHLDTIAGDNPFARQIAYGVVRHYFSLGCILDQLLSKPLPSKHADLRLLLLAGIYSVQHLKRPAYTSVNATVEATAGLHKPWAKGLVNGVLRQYLRRPPDINGIEAELDHPAWLIKAIESAWPDRPEIFASNNQQAPMTLRVNLGKISRSDYLALLESSGMAAKPGKLTPTAVTLAQPLAVDAIPGFTAGLVSVQDEAAQLAAYLLDPAPGMSVLDACAAPGGKTCHLLEAEPQINLTAMDPDARRMQLLEDNLTRLGLVCNRKIASLLDINMTAATPGQPARGHDGKAASPDSHTIASSIDRALATASPGQPARGHDGKAAFPDSHTITTGFDRILLDAPCTATGIIRRHPDIKLMRNPTDVDKLCKLQSELLQMAFDLLAPGGELLYSTCSILPQENDQVVSSLLPAKSGGLGMGSKSALNSDLSRACLLPIALEALADCPTAVPTPAGLQLFPDTSTHDGFFYARIKKATSEHNEGARA